MEWNSIDEDKPKPYDDVLVAQFYADPDCPEFFVAHYNERDNEWKQNMSFNGKGMPFFILDREVLPRDKWTSIQFDSSTWA